MGECGYHASVPTDHDFICFIEPAREGMIDQPTDAEAAAVEAHFRYLKSLTEQGVVVLAGRTLEEPYAGIVIFRAAGPTAAERIMRDDPALRAGVFRARLQSFRIALLQGGV
jgi:uncharacterized protein YciI